MTFVRIECGVAETLNALREVPVMSVRVEEKYTEIGIKRKDLHKAIAICGQKCYNYTITDNTLRRTRRAIFRRLPLIAASLLAAAMLFVSDAFVWRVEVRGADGAAEMRVIRTLKEAGVHAGALLSSVDGKTAERALIERGGVSAASVRREGSVIVADVLPASAYGGAAEYSDRLVSGYDCIVTRVVAECGTPVVRAGDVAAKGDVLIEGKEYNTADGSDAGTVAVRGRVYGRVTFSFSAPAEESGAPVRTGRSETHTSVGMFGFAFGGAGSPYEYFESSTERARLYPIPVDVVRTTYYELEPSAFAGEAERFAQEKADELLAAYGVPFERRIALTEKNGAAVMTVYFTAEICVGEI